MRGPRIPYVMQGVAIQGRNDNYISTNNRTKKRGLRNRCPNHKREGRNSSRTRGQPWGWEYKRGKLDKGARAFWGLATYL